jgi:hypothetical protein
VNSQAANTLPTIFVAPASPTKGNAQFIGLRVGKSKVLGEAPLKKSGRDDRSTLAARSDQMLIELKHMSPSMPRQL